MVKGLRPGGVWGRLRQGWVKGDEARQGYEGLRVCRVEGDEDGLSLGTEAGQAQGGQILIPRGRTQHRDQSQAALPGPRRPG